MGKTYFLNSADVVKIAENFEELHQELTINNDEKQKILIAENLQISKRTAFLQINCKSVNSVISRPELFHETAQEMNGKYGWFNSSNKSYNMTEYYSGWIFESKEQYAEFLKI